MWLLSDEEITRAREEHISMTKVHPQHRAIARAQLRQVVHLLTEMCVEEIPLADWNALLDESGIGHYED